MLIDLDNLLQKGAIAYLQTSRSSTVTGQPAMTERERQKFEDEAEQCIKQCETNLTQLKVKIAAARQQNPDSQRLQHWSEILLYLLDFHAAVSATYWKQKTMRLESTLEERTSYTIDQFKQTLHAHRYARPLEASASSNSFKSTPSSPSDGERRAATPMDRKNNNLNRNDEEDALFQRVDGEEDYFEADNVRRRGDVVDIDHIAMDSQLQEQLKRENLVLQSSLANMSDEIRQVEQQIVVISQAQQLIAHNLMQQRDDLEHIHKHTKQATVDINKGNRELEKAAQSSSKFRLFMLVFLLSASFLLLVLHKVES